VTWKAYHALHSHQQLRGTAFGDPGGGEGGFQKVEGRLGRDPQEAAHGKRVLALQGQQKFQALAGTNLADTGLLQP